MKDFIVIAGERIRKSTIKRYKPFGDTKINVYYNTSTYKVELQTFDLGTKRGKDEMLDYLDLHFGIK